MKITAVIVTYQPDEAIRSLVKSLRQQVSEIVVVDNGSAPECANLIRSLQGEAVEARFLERNYGIACAHNRGIARAKANGATHVLLLDQDSVPEPDMVKGLFDAEQQLLLQGHRVGALGPVYHDPRLGKTWPFYRLSRFGVKPHGCGDPGGVDPPGVVPCDFLISSGTLIRIPVLDEVGPMNEGYFLEHVDTEWSLRARHCGFRLFGACRARMEHTLGDDVIRVPVNGRGIQLYQPYRHYYLFRNAVLLGREKYAVLPWKLNEIRRLLLRLVFFSLFVPPRRIRLRMMLLGLWHGLLGRAGPLEGRATG